MIGNSSQVAGYNYGFDQSQTMECIKEFVCEDAKGCYAGNDKIKLCLDELIVAENLMWEDICIDADTAKLEQLAWDKIYDYNQVGYNLLSSLRQPWMRGETQLIDGCKLKKCTYAALNDDSFYATFPVSEAIGLYIYIDGSSILSDNTMSWAIACFYVDNDLRHNIAFNTGGCISMDPWLLTFMVLTSTPPLLQRSMLASWPDYGYYNPT